MWNMNPVINVIENVIKIDINLYRQYTGKNASRASSYRSSIITAIEVMFFGGLISADKFKLLMDIVNREFSI